MGKLTALTARLSSPKAKTRFSSDPNGRSRSTSSGPTPWRAWYATPRWKALRKKVFLRDNYTCQRTGVICAGCYPDPDSPVANHKRPHRGDAALFWDEGNIETVTKEVHDTLIQQEEQASLHHRGIWT